MFARWRAVTLQIFATTKSFRDRLNALDILDDVDLIKRYRLTRSLIVDLVHLLEPQIASPTNRSHAVPASIQVLCALRYYAGGCFQKDSGDLHGISQSSVSKFINNVSTAICSHANEHIKFSKYPAKTDAYNLTIIYAWVVEEWCKSKINFVKFNPDNIISISNVEKTKTKEL